MKTPPCSSKTLCALFACLLAATAVVSPAFGLDDVVLVVNGTTVSPAPADLTDAVNTANTDVYAITGINAVDVGITLNNVNQLNTTGVGGVNSLFFLHAGPSTDPTNVATQGGFKNVTITGNGKSIGFADGTANAGRVMEIINAAGKVTLTGLTITGGNAQLTATNLNTGEYLGGGGLHIGAASGASKYVGKTPGKNPSEISIGSTTFSGNQLLLTIDSTATDGRAVMGGGAFIDATNYASGTPGSKVTLTSVSFSKNTVKLDSSDHGTGSSSFGGGLRVKNASEFIYTGGTISENSVETVNGSHAAGGGIVIDDFTKKATLTSLTISENEAIMTGSGVTGYPSKALGGGLYTYHDGTGGDNLELSVTSTTFSKNKATATGANVDAYGGGAFLNDGTQATFSGGGFSENTATSALGEAWGGGLAQTASSYTLTLKNSIVFSKNIAKGKTFGKGGAVYSTGATTLTGAGLSENEAQGETALGGGMYTLGAATLESSTGVLSNKAVGEILAQGGGVYAGSTLSMDKAGIGKNEATTSTDPGGKTQGGGAYVIGAATISNGSSIYENKATGIDLAEGGGIYAGSTLTADASSFDSNTASAKEASGGGIYAVGNAELKNKSTLSNNIANGTTLAQGGGLYATANATIDSSSVSKNTATGKEAFGGGLYVKGTSDFKTGSALSGNTAKGTDLAQGGGLYSQGAVTMDGTTVSGNAATATTTAQGGGIYAEDNVTLTDTSVTNNTATGTTAQGGGVYMDTSNTNALLTIASTAGKTVDISGNKAGGVANSIYFGGNGAAANSGLVVDSAGIVNLLEPLQVNMGAGAFAFSRGTATGTLNWGGANTFKADNVTFNFNAGETYLNADYTATMEGATNLAVTIDSTVAFSGTRANDKALFTYGAGTAETFSITGTGDIKVDLSSQLLDGTYKYLVADNYDGTDTGFNGWTSTTANYNSKLEQIGNEIWLTTEYKTLYGNIIAAADPNTKAAIDSGALSDKFETLTDDQRAQLTSSQDKFNNATPGWLMNGVLSGLNTIIAGADAARAFGLNNASGNSGYMGMSASSTQGLASFNTESSGYNGPRFWSGYIGDFDRTDSHGGYYGYKADRHGILFGINYDVGTLGSIGLYGGYSNTQTKAKGVTAKIKSDTGHAGVIGRIAPLREMPNLTLNADVGYTFGSNDSERGDGSLRTKGEYDQKYYTVGLEASYALRLGSLSLNPFASARYVKVKQDSFTETGTLASHVGDVNETMFNTRLGTSITYDIQTGFGVVKPSVSVAWRHDFGDAQYNANAFYQGVATPITYNIKSAKMDRDSMDVGAAIRTLLRTGEDDRQLGLNLGYNLNVSKNRDNHSLYVGFDLSF